VGVACGKCEGEERCIQGFWWGHLQGKCHFQDLGIHRKIILRLNFQEVQWGGVDCIHRSQDRYHWRGAVNAVLNIMLRNKPTNAHTNMIQDYKQCANNYTKYTLFEFLYNNILTIVALATIIRMLLY